MKKKHLLYVVNHSYPYSTDGYAVRTHAVAKSLQLAGFRVTVLNRLGRLWVAPGVDASKATAEQKVDSVRYLFFRSPSPIGKSWLQWSALAESAYRDIYQMLQPDLIMAASNWENAKPALDASRGNYPFIYEVRGFWELTRLSREPSWESTHDFKLAYAHESNVACGADRVFTLNNFMKAELINRGVNGDKIDILPNSVIELPTLTTPTPRWREKLGIKSKFILGYIGSFNDYEGLPLLVEMLKDVRERGFDASLLFAGSVPPHMRNKDPNGLDPMQEVLLEKAEQLGVKEHLYFTGRLARDAVQELYCDIDVIVNPRLDTPVTRIVSSLKSLEALSFGIPLVLSDIPPHQELLDEAPSTFRFKSGDAESLTTSVTEVLSGLSTMNTQDSIDWVSRNRLYPDILRRLLG